jgi:hypothetical protein
VLEVFDPSLSCALRELLDWEGVEFMLQGRRQHVFSYPFPAIDMIPTVFSGLESIFV